MPASEALTYLDTMTNDARIVNAFEMSVYERVALYLDKVMVAEYLDSDFLQRHNFLAGCRGRKDEVLSLIPLLTDEEWSEIYRLLVETANDGAFMWSERRVEWTYAMDTYREFELAAR